MQHQSFFTELFSVFCCKSITPAKLQIYLQIVFANNFKDGGNKKAPTIFSNS